MQTEYIIESEYAPQEGNVGGGQEVVNVTHEFPENGFSYEDMRNGLCRAYVRVTQRSCGD